MFSLPQQCSLKNSHLTKSKCFTRIYWFCSNLQKKPVRKMGQMALSPASCLSTPPWFLGVSSPLHLAGEVLVLPCPVTLSQAGCPGGRRHQHGLCPSSRTLLTTCTRGQRAATRVVWLSCPMRCLAFWTFPQQAG